MEIVALQEYTDNKISLYEGQIRNIGNNLAQKLIAEGVVAEHSDSGSEGGNDILYVNIGQRTGQTTYDIDKTGKEVISHINKGKPVKLLHFSGGIIIEYHMYTHVTGDSAWFYTFQIASSPNDLVTPTAIKFKHAVISNTDDRVIRISENIQIYPAIN